MSELSINDLPFEILAEVFRYLDVVNLKNATLTCQFWNNLIESEHRWSLKLDEWNYDNCPHSAEQKINFVLTTNRKFGTIEIENMDFFRYLNQIHQLFQRHGFNVVKLILRRITIQTLNQFVEFLNFTTNLEHVILEWINLNDVQLDHALPDLKKLKNLKIDHSDQRIIKCFRKAKLRSIKIGDDRHSKGCVASVDFLLSQELLTSLTDLAGLATRSILTEMGKSNVPIPFRLTHLAVSGNVESISSLHDYNNNLLSFVKSQAKHLSELELGYGMPSTVYECAISSMPKLNSLTLHINGVPQDNEFYDRLKENCSIRTMKIASFSVQQFQFIHHFLERLPNICSLTLPFYYIDSEKILVMAQSLRKLESVTTGYVDEKSIDYVKFPNLTTFHIQWLIGKIDWNEFTKAHPLLTNLAIVKMDKHLYLTSDDIDQITTNVDLHNMRIGAGFVADDRFFEIIRTKCTNLKVLGLCKSCLPHGRDYNVGVDVLRLCNYCKFSKYPYSCIFDF